MTTTTRDEFPSLAQFNARLEPYGWIQFKGSDLCMDVHCTCGALLHLDADFAYHVQCPHCLQYYECSGFIDLIPLDFRPTNPILLDRDGERDELIDELNKDEEPTP